jgi:hypothetical protein
MLVALAVAWVIRFWILDFGFWIDPTDQSAFLGILDFGFPIGSTDKSAFLYHQGMIGQNNSKFKIKREQGTEG